MNLSVDSRGTEDCYGQARERRLSSVGVLPLEPGQQVVWTYRPHVPPQQIYLVEAEVVQAGTIRARIRLCDTEGNILLRWVKPERLRYKKPNELLHRYPARRISR